MDHTQGKQLANLGLQQMLRAYMHGFFIDHRLHERAKAVTDPFSYDEWRKRKLKGRGSGSGRGRAFVAAQRTRHQHIF